MKIEKFVTGIISTNCYIVTNEETKETVIVDPANLSKAMIGYIEEEELVIKAILLTHAHFDRPVWRNAGLRRRIRSGASSHTVYE